MENKDRERQRLDARYAAMSEGELRKIAEDAGSLTDEAVDALKEEIRRKGLDIQIGAGPVGTEELEFQQLVTIREFRDLPEAELAKGLIESAGIEVFLADDNIVRMDWFYSNAVGGIKLQVKAEDAATAIDVLEQPIPDNFDVEGVGDYAQPCCPQCQSIEVTFWPVGKKSWKCDACGYEWEDAISDGAVEAQ